MRINGLNGANTPVGGMNMTKATDSVSKNIQNQIANAQKQLQELSANKDMSIEEKMKKRQEIQQQITDLNNQLRQHQIEQRKEQQAKKSSMDDMLGGSKKTAPKAGKQSTGLSQASMKAMISADSAMAQAQVQGGVATKMEGRAGVLESEIKLDSARGDDVEAKKEELAEVEQKAVQAESAQMNTLATANKELEEAAYIDGTGVFQTFFRIILPLSVPMMITVFLFSFSWQWTDVFYSDIFFYEPGISTAATLLPDIYEQVPVHLENAFKEHSGYSMYTMVINNTAGIMIILPLVVIYLFCQRYLVQGIERSGLVG